MQLKQYLFVYEIKIKDFAKKCVCSANHMSGLVNFKVKPGPRLAQEIERRTKGLVTAKEIRDMYDEIKKLRDAGVAE